MKMTNFDAFNRCISNSSYLDLEELSKIQEYEERFMKFLRYVEILNESDERKVEAKKLIDRIFDLEKFKGLQNTSLQVYDNESMIYEEEVIIEEGGAHVVQMALLIQTHPGRDKFKTINPQEFF